MKNNKKNLILIVSGIVFILVGVYFSLQSIEFSKSGAPVKAEIVSIEREYNSDKKEKIKVFVEYVVDSKKYQSTLDFYSSALKKGDIITVLYLKDNPSKIHYAQFDFVPKLLFYAGGITCFTFFIIHNCKRKNN